MLLTAQLWPFFSKSFARGLTLFSAILLLVVCIRWCVIYRAIGSVQRESAALIRSADSSNAAAIQLPPYPYSDYVWRPDPLDEETGALFDAFYHVPPGTAAIAPDPEYDYEQRHMHWY